MTLRPRSSVAMLALLLAVAGVRTSAADSAATPSGETIYREACDGSAGIALGGDGFADAYDEDQVLRIYRIGDPKVQDRVRLDDFLAPPEGEEVDIEACARIGKVVYWIGSHSANKNGKLRAGRRRLFATKIVDRDGGQTLERSGTPYSDLLKDIANDADLPKDVRDAITSGASKPPKEDGGLSIEGLAPHSDRHLLIGLRNPVPGGLALVLPVMNPGDLVEGRGPAKFGPVARLALDGFGIRSLEWVPSTKEFLVLAGPIDEGFKRALYRWTGKPDDAPVRIPMPGVSADFNAEGLFVVEDGHRTIVHLLSDDGERKVNGKDCKDEDVPAKDRTFRGVHFEL